MSSTTLRHISMLKLIPKYPSYILTSSIKNQLAEQGFDVSLRTIQRDLENLSSVMGITCINSADGNQWQYINSGNEILPAIQPAEALLLCIAKEQLSSILPFTALNQLEPRFNKAEETLKISEKFKDWRDRIKIINTGFPLIANDVLDDLRSSVYEAILNKKQIKLVYRIKVGELKEYTLNSHGLIIRSNSHYLVASKFESPDNFQLFKLSKMHEVTALNEDNLPCESDIKTYLCTNASGFLLSKIPIKLEMLVTGPALSLLQEGTMSSNQTLKISQLKGKSIATVTATVEFTQDLVHFLVGFGGFVKVLQPESLIVEIKSRMINQF